MILETTCSTKSMSRSWVRWCQPEQSGSAIAIGWLGGELSHLVLKTYTLAQLTELLAPCDAVPASLRFVTQLQHQRQRRDFGEGSLTTLLLHSSVAKVDSVALVVRICSRCSDEKS